MPAHENGPSTSDLCVVIDEALDRFRSRHLVNGSEVVDFLLDLRLVVELDARLAGLLEPVAG